MTDKEALDWVAHRAVGCFVDPDLFEDAQATALRQAHNEGVESVIQLIHAARNDKICPQCGNREHRPDTMPGISMDAYNHKHGPRARMIR